jgi:uncharacterized protein (DUF1697 family)
MQWVGLVRNVMLGREGLSRNVLLGVVRGAGGQEARSHLTTGNVTFHAAPTELHSVVEQIENGIEHVLARKEMVAVRSVAWLRELVAEDHFASYFDAAWETEVGFLRHDAPVVDRNRIGDSGRTVLVEVRSREVLAARPRKGGARPHVNRLLEEASNSPATARGWSTLQRIATSASLLP